MTFSFDTDSMDVTGTRQENIPKRKLEIWIILFHTRNIEKSSAVRNELYTSRFWNSSLETCD